MVDRLNGIYSTK